MNEWAAYLITAAIVLTIAMGIASLWDGKARGWVMLGAGVFTAFMILWHQLN